jgi:hypothetical protein
VEAAGERRPAAHGEQAAEPTLDFQVLGLHATQPVAAKPVKPGAHRQSASAALPAGERELAGHGVCVAAVDGEGQ